ncbi:DUF6624 domain-containing protein [Lacinutrix jangbogonensis]|uniref:DUF6624 domain-containing protein n=1 Tax=Lacinutrix jangbogonensis TaxID=1469557 RepID=UPI00068FC5A0|nr:DUF6624 domain-containing protein [Lacinutrix jangbogonensis]
MKKYIIITALILLSTISTTAQEQEKSYSELIRAGWKLCLEKNFKASATLYEQAFKVNEKASLTDRYNASCINALANNTDAAYKHLFIAVNDLKWHDLKHLKNDTDLISIRSDKRWNELISAMQKNKLDIEKHFDKALVSILDEIYFDDQSTRSQMRTKEEKYGRDSKEMKAFWKTILKNDSINLIKVSEILDTQGWPSKERIGVKGSSTLFLVIQHSNLKTQIKYLPFINEAMKTDNITKREYAMFYDRLTLGQGKRQVYGTQLAMSKERKKPYVLPLEDPINVDKRRAEMGMNSMQENLNRWDITWDVEAYIKILPEIEAKEKELNKKITNNIKK